MVRSLFRTGIEPFTDEEIQHLGNWDEVAGGQLAPMAKVGSDTLYCEQSNKVMDSAYDLLTADFPCSKMLNRIRDLLEPPFPLGNHVRFYLSFLDESRQFIIDEGRQVLALTIVSDGEIVLNTECGEDQSVYERGELVGKGEARVIMERTDDVDILPDCLDFVGCVIENNDSASGTLCQGTHGEGMCLVKRDRVEGEMDVIASGFLQLLGGVGVLVLYQQSRERSANPEKRARNQSTNIKDKICAKILDELVVVWGRDGSHLVAREFRELDRILADRTRSSVDKKPRVSEGSLITGLGKPQGLRSV